MMTYRLGTVGDRVRTHREKNRAANTWSPSDVRTATPNTSSFHPRDKTGFNSYYYTK